MRADAIPHEAVNDVRLTSSQNRSFAGICRHSLLQRAGLYR